MKPAIAPRSAKPSGSSCGKEKSGSRTDQFGNWNFNPSQRSLFQRSPMRPRSSTRCGKARRLRWCLIPTPAWLPPCTGVWTRSAGMARRPGLAGRRLRRGADDPAPERREVTLFGPVAAIDQIPAHALGHRGRERSNKPSGGEIVVDIGPDAHGDAEPVAGGLQRLAVVLEFRAACGNARGAGRLEPERPVLRSVRDAEQAWPFEIARALERRRKSSRRQRARPPRRW